MFKYRFTIERPQLRTWRGHKVPFILQVRYHYPTGNRVLFNLWGPNIISWCKKHKEFV